MMSLSYLNGSLGESELSGQLVPLWPADIVVLEELCLEPFDLVRTEGGAVAADAGVRPAAPAPARDVTGGQFGGGRRRRAALPPLGKLVGAVTGGGLTVLCNTTRETLGQSFEDHI